jgi:galactose oxidase
LGRPFNGHRKTFGQWRTFVTNARVAVMPPFRAFRWRVTRRPVTRRVALAGAGVVTACIAVVLAANNSAVLAGEHQGTPVRAIGHMPMIDAPHESYVTRAAALPRTGWTATASDQATANPANDVLDGNAKTIWHSWYVGTPKPLPHSITIDTHTTMTVAGLTYLPRQDGWANGDIGRYTIAVSTGNSTWRTVTTGVWSDNNREKSAVFAPVSTRYVRITATTEAGNRGPWTSAAEINLIGGTIAPPPLPRAGWTATASDPEAQWPAGNVLDGNATTIWHTKFINGVAPLPHRITIDMHAKHSIAGLTYLPRADGSNNGDIGKYSISVSTNGLSWGTPVATGTWADGTAMKTAVFPRTTARYVRLTATSEAGNRGQWSSAAEINILGSAPSAATGGRWSAPLNFPLVPVSAVLLPNNKLLTFAALDDVTFNSVATTTVVTILDLNTGLVSAPSTVDTHHQMFCTGLAVLGDGRVLIDGGSSDAATTIYNPADNSWTKGPLLNIPRAYQGDTVTSTGQVLTLGGSWDDSKGHKDGELYTPNSGTGSWAKLPGVSAARILTGDPAGIFRADNHAWLFGVSNGMVFHAGPSKQMNWISTSGTGSITPAGNRSDSLDAMNGNAVMYDVGKILTVGGAIAYQDAGTVTNVQANNRAYVVDITGGPTKPVVTTRVGDMAYARAFANSVVLPDGTVLTMGGQQHPAAFTDTGAVLSPELWDPATGDFTVLAPELVSRVYHSVAVLLQDGTVFSGGGGLCGVGCTANHPDGQIFTPPYLLNSDGTERDRPSIASAPTSAAPGDTITVTTDSATPSFALVRTGAVTHSVDNDQRRIPLKPVSTDGHTYQLAIPADAGVVPPGNYMLFAMDAVGTPSVAKIINIR